MGNYLPATKGEFRDVKKELGDVKKELGDKIGDVKKELGDVKKELGDVKKELGDKIGDVKQELGDMKDDLKNDLKKEVGDIMLYQTGSYYRIMKRTWKSEPEEFEGAAVKWEKLRQKDTEVILYYKDSSKRGSDKVRYNKANFSDSTLFPPVDKSMAHLIPSDQSCSLAWLRALSIVTGIDVGDKSPILCPLLRNFVEGTVISSAESSAEQLSQRVDNPLKCWNWNFLMLPNGHYKHFDQVSTTKHVIITPIWDPEQKWSPKTVYKVMVSADPESYRWLLGLNIEEGRLEWFGTGNPEELQTATDFLALTVKALAHLLIQHGRDDLETPFLNQLSNKGRSSVIDTADAEDGKHGNEIHNDDSAPDVLRSVFESIEGAIPSDLLSSTRDSSTKDASTGKSGKTSRKSNPPWAKEKAKAFRTKVEKLLKVTESLKTIQVPVLHNTGSKNERPVLTVDLGIYFKGREHLIPDPFLVVLKAAVSWSVYTNQRLLPACNVCYRSDESQQSGSDGSMSLKSDIMRPLEIACSLASISPRTDDDSAMSLSESITGSPGDGLLDNDDCLELIPALTPCSAQAVHPAMVTP
ncbi:hypothetical protein ACA910_003610 [Epithemia clementina (nom. ined.)]